MNTITTTNKLAVTEPPLTTSKVRFFTSETLRGHKKIKDMTPEERKEYRRAVRRRYWERLRKFQPERYAKIIAHNRENARIYSATHRDKMNEYNRRYNQAAKDARMKRYAEEDQWLADILARCIRRCELTKEDMAKYDRIKQRQWYQTIKKEDPERYQQRLEIIRKNNEKYKKIKI